MLRRIACGVSAIAVAAALAPPDHDHCTGVIAGPKATVDGYTMVGQTDDGEGGPGSSVIFVPAQDHLPGSERPVYDQETHVQMGTVPQVNHTYAYTYTTLGYAVMNEHKLAFGETTCSGRIAAKSLASNGTALFSNSELTKLAVERCKTARCAVELMGDFAQHHGGFYGEGFDVDTGSETLLVADPTEAWVFNILADPTGTSAIWAAQKVPDDQIVFVPNVFVIRAMDLDDSSQFLLSSNAKDIAANYGWWTPGSPFDWAAAFSLGEYAAPHYAARRLWRAFSLVAPSLKLDPSPVISDKSAGYPFGVKPDRLLTPADVFAVYRDYYEGTPFSLVADTLAAGPFNSPLRVAAGDAEGKVQHGAWERPISIYRTDYAVVSVCSPVGHGVVWYAPKTAHASLASPVWTSAATAIARPYVVDGTQSVDRESLFWAVSAVSNWAFGSAFSKAIVDIRKAQQLFETSAHALGEALVTMPAEKHNEVLFEQAQKAHSYWWNFFFTLMGKYNDGYKVTHKDDGSFSVEQYGYPSWWLEKVGFDKAVDAPAAAFQDLNQRMEAAAKTFAQIDATRHYPPPRAGATLLV